MGLRQADGTDVFLLRASSKKGPDWALFQVKLALLLQPTFDDVRTVFCFPLFQGFVISALGFDDLTGLWVFIHLELSWFAWAGCRG